MSNHGQKTFPARRALDSFRSVESRIAEALDVIPYCSEHRDVWSPQFATIILEACSQIDSIWKAVIRDTGKIPLAKQKKLKMPDYFSVFGDAIAPEWAVFFEDDSPSVIGP